jgi:hypothetical protein
LPRSRSRQLADAISAMATDHLICRDYGHAWERSSCVHVLEPRGHVVGYERTLICTRCTTTRTEQLDRYGDKIRNGYRYASGYSVSGLGRLTGSDRALMRVASLESMLTGEVVATP